MSWVSMFRFSVPVLPRALFASCAYVLAGCAAALAVAVFVRPHSPLSVALSAAQPLSWWFS
ncbi:hypothetical protein [Burkholderia alba]|uniref:hypothetical protein n=1 Tax=Burkholderia alba TaxID=2683677 RepID=UPI002B056A86|nr:hypothetical protein [Burkholderia alba]